MPEGYGIIHKSSEATGNDIWSANPKKVSPKNSRTQGSHAPFKGSEVLVSLSVSNKTHSKQLTLLMLDEHLDN